MQLENETQGSVSRVATPVASQSMGEILVQSGRLSLHAAEQVMQYQRENGLRFGEAAVKLKLITQDDLDQVLSKQFSYAYLRKGDGGLSNDLVAAYRPFSKPVENLRALRSQLMLRWFSDERKVLALVGTGAEDGRTYTLANLGVVFSQLGERTLLIDADLRAPRLHQVFNVDNSTGLSSVLAGRTNQDVIRRVEALANLSVLPAGPIPPNPQELLSSDGFGRVIETAENHFDVILIDTPASRLYSDAEILSARIGGAVVVTRKGRSRLSETRRLVDTLGSLGVHVVGTVLNEG